MLLNVIVEFTHAYGVGEKLEQKNIVPHPGKNLGRRVVLFFLKRQLKRCLTVFYIVYVFGRNSLGRR